MFEPRPLAYAGVIGVIDMELLSVIRRWRYRDHYSIREISRRTGLSRNTVRKSCAGQRRAEVQHSRPREQAGPLRRQAVADAAAGGREVAQAEADGQAIARRSDRPRLRRLLQSRGGLRSRLEGRPAAGTEDVRAAAHLCRWCFCPGEAFQFDWSEDWAIIGGERPNCRSLTSSSPTSGSGANGRIWPVMMSAELPEGWAWAS